MALYWTVLIRQQLNVVDRNQNRVTMIDTVGIGFEIVSQRDGEIGRRHTGRSHTCCRGGFKRSEGHEKSRKARIIAIPGYRLVIEKGLTCFRMEAFALAALLPQDF